MAIRILKEEKREIPDIIAHRKGHILESRSSAETILGAAAREEHEKINQNLKEDEKGKDGLLIRELDSFELQKNSCHKILLLRS